MNTHPKPNFNLRLCRGFFYTTWDMILITHLSADHGPLSKRVHSVKTILTIEVYPQRDARCSILQPSFFIKNPDQIS